MLREYEINEEDREKALKIAAKRCRFEMIDSVFQQAIAEVMLQKVFSFMVSFGDAGIDVKCVKITNIHVGLRFFLNIQKFQNNKAKIKYVLCCGVDNKPQLAKKFYIFGWINGEKVEKYPVNANCISPVYQIPIRDMFDVFTLMCKSEFDGEKIVGKM